MNERTTLEIIASTVEEALAQGLSQLGLTADAVSVEVLDSGSKGLFGLGGRQVRVRLTVNPPASEVQSASSAPEPFDQTQGKPAPAKRAVSTPKKKQAAAPRPIVKRTEAPEKSEKKESAPSPSDIPHDGVLEATEAVVSKIIHHLGMEAQVSAHYDESSRDDRLVIHVDVRGDDLTALIGRHAETLNAFQHIASLIVGKETDHWVQLNIDVEGYRARREKQIRQMASRMADQVAKAGRKATMEPMPASERRLVHIELRSHPAVTTESTGEEPYRKVVILPKE
jgi:spoIIIJ-associated protein